jgi:hypothetical protein
MITTPTIVISDRPIPFAAVWVHLKPRPYQPSNYTVSVPRVVWPAVFDPTVRRPEGLAWSRFLWSEVGEFGTFIVQGWFKKMSRHLKEDTLPWEWVIATVDEIIEEGDVIRLAGRAERFMPKRFG